MVIIVLAGTAIRVFTAFSTCIINPDGMVYIQQAKAIYSGDWHLLKSCVPFVSNYPFFIAGAYFVYPDWVVAARGVSVFFGSLALVPLFFLVRRFADEKTSFLCLLLYAFIPFLVSGSADLVRDPVCWFFLVWGLYVFVSQLGMREKGWKHFLVLLSSYALMFVAGWARPEALVVLIVSSVYSLFHSVHSGDRRKVWVSLSVPLCVAIIFGAGILVFDPSIDIYYKNASARLSGTLEQYENLRSQLETVADDFRGQPLGSFLSKARNLVWLNAVGVLISGSLAGYFYPYIPFFLFGFLGLWEKIKKNGEVAYLLALFVTGYALLFFHVLHFWYFEHRFLYIVVFPACVLAALGLGNIRLFAERKAGWRTPVTVALICLYIAGFGLGKNVKKRDADKVIFRDIAQYIRAKEKSPKQFIPVLTGDSSLMRLVPFYLNLDAPRGFCPMYLVTNIKDFGDLMDYVQKEKINYFLWNERSWSKTKVDIHSDQFRRNFTADGHWFHESCGDMILFHRDSSG